ncbi:hypothetical protein [Segniliparus rugosus]|uniref:DUF4177 domain-containing protein n=1 Tax=Segniliparus rugosus (strain ATCC BAA-974 / DSM 45345 / CCUG 50838 / CIP 108380 / JCM 13579 / CDC 945) TaxID=679197 RepID=E5XMS5_SEGRC|nr:hypothetical protein [Segniliparus rugosus]EFV14345.2 hypothetical protein HMPREF9336_00795 [Segniliparus rugosus ATCC BAA-974]
MADEVLAGDRRYEWLNVDVVRSSGYKEDAKDVISKRGHDGWAYFDQRPSPNGDENVVLVFYKAK